jgi:hypothetical protein
VTDAPNTRRYVVTPDTVPTSPLPESDPITFEQYRDELLARELLAAERRAFPGAL